MQTEVNGKTYNVVNVDDFSENFWGHNYIVSFSPIGHAMVVNAEHAQAAVDEFADYALEQGWHGYFLDEDDLAGYHEDDICYVGNFGKPVLSYDIFCVEVY